jgi:hypothetical protein
MSNNILNDISKVYLETVVESAVPGKPAERLGAVSAIPKSEQDAARQRTLAKAKEKRKKMGESVVGDKARNAVADQRLYDAQRDTQQSVDKLAKREKVTRASAHIAAKRVEADVRKSSSYGPQRPKPGTTGAYRIEGLDPVGKEDADVDNDGKSNTKKDKYLMNRRNVIKQELATQKEAKEVKKWWDDDGDGKGYEEGEVSGKFKKKKKEVKEGYSNWRQDLSEVITKDQNETPIKEKKVENKIVINPPMKIGEAVSNLGGELVEMVEFEGVLDEFHDSELMFLSNELIEEVVEEFFYECLEEGYEIDEVEDMLIESIETSASILNEAKVTLGHDTKIERKSDRLQKVKSAVKKVARGVGYAAGAAVRGVKAIGREVKAGYAAGRGSDSESSSSSGTRKPQPYRNTHQQSKKPGLLSRLGSKLKSGLKKAVASGARAVSRGARDVARKMDGGSSSPTPKSTPSSTKKPAEKSADPWEGSATTPPKAKAKPAAKPKAKKKTGKLDSILADIRKEEVELDEKINVGADAGATISDFVHSKSKTFKGDSKKQRINRALGAYYAAKKAKVDEAMMPGEEVPTSTPAPTVDKNKNQQLNNLKVMQQKQRQLQQQRFNLQKQNKLPLHSEDFVDESTADDALALVKKGMNPKSILGSPEQKAAQAAQPKPKPQEPRKLQPYSIPGAPKGKSYND